MMITCWQWVTVKLFSCLYERFDFTWSTKESRCVLFIVWEHCFSPCSTQYWGASRGQTAFICINFDSFDHENMRELPDAGTIGPLTIAGRLFSPRQGREGPVDTPYSLRLSSRQPHSRIDRPNGNLV